MNFTVPLITKNPLNGSQGRSRGAALGRARRRKKERHTARLCAIAAYVGPLQPYGTWMPVVTLSRLYASDRWKMDHDGLQAALKGIRDGIADALGVDDGSAAVTWKYDQKKCKRGEFGVEVQIA